MLSNNHFRCSLIQTIYKDLAEGLTIKSYHNCVKKKIIAKDNQVPYNC